MAEQIKLVNDDFQGHVDILRHACRGILVREGKVLLCCESDNDKYIIPGGGVEGSETYAECCEREMLEETGIQVRAVTGYLDIEELFDVWNHVNHYFICEFVKDTGARHLTKAEARAGYRNVWLPLERALEIFGNYEAYHDKNIADFGLYRREYTALKEYEKMIKDLGETRNGRRMYT